MEEEILSGGGEGGDKDKKVMVAIDESECSHYALVWALDNLRESISGPDAQLLIFMAQPPPQHIITFAASLGSARLYCPVSATLDFVNSVQENHKKLTLALLDRAKEICAERGVKVETIAEVGEPKTAICDAVQKYNVDLVVMGEHGLGRIKRAFLGSVSSYCIQNAKCPVLVVKKPK
ncbi:universal stress protein A-like protein isoform X2 [Punica granatum]|uniref:UspA domain-containing protein n=2 Tax=Punica granatum TaxID=22663 RepID=A0A218XNQ6_PUNGR|nr:universal stress protein A-like protein isoform X2 [Punica granatum]OWM86309.1 hypothetical protein CDL15_Pgr011133 [Punica granatum]PKI33597.1 hypothetical protein CRG98_046008 [Punica granatum]